MQIKLEEGAPTKEKKKTIPQARTQTRKEGGRCGEDRPLWEAQGGEKMRGGRKIGDENAQNALKKKKQKNARERDRVRNFGL